MLQAPVRSRCSARMLLVINASCNELLCKIGAGSEQKGCSSSGRVRSYHSVLIPIFVKALSLLMIPAPFARAVDPINASK